MNRKQLLVVILTLGVFVSVFTYTALLKKNRSISNLVKNQELQAKWEVVNGCTLHYENGTTTKKQFSVEIPSSVEVDRISLSQKCISPSNSDHPLYYPNNAVLPSRNPEIFSVLSLDMKYLILIKKDHEQEKKYNLFFSNLVNKTLIKIDSYSFSNSITESQKEFAKYLRSYNPDLPEQIANILQFIHSEMFQVKGDKYIVYTWYPKNSVDNLLTTEKVVDMKGQLVFQPNCDQFEPINFNADLSKILYSCKVSPADSSRLGNYYVFDFSNTINLTTPYLPTNVGLNYTKFVGTTTIEFFTKEDEISKEDKIENRCTISRYHMDINGGNLKYIGRTPACF